MQEAGAVGEGLMINGNAEALDMRHSQPFGALEQAERLGSWLRQAAPKVWKRERNGLRQKIVYLWLLANLMSVTL